MDYYTRAIRHALLACLVVGLAASCVRASDTPPNWRGSAVGSTHPEGGVDVDVFGGQSAHLGAFTAAGFHVLNPVDFTFAGVATWTAANGDSLSVTFSGQIFLSGDPDFPFGFEAILVADGGTGRFANARGRAAMTGGFSGVPGDFHFSFAGTLLPNGN